MKQRSGKEKSWRKLSVEESSTLNFHKNISHLFLVMGDVYVMSRTFCESKYFESLFNVGNMWAGIVNTFSCFLISFYYQTPEFSKFLPQTSKFLIQPKISVHDEIFGIELFRFQQKTHKFFKFSRLSWLKCSHEISASTVLFSDDIIIRCTT